MGAELSSRNARVLPISLSPCPFCQGPPVPVCVDTIERRVFACIPEQGRSVDAYVFCHECGAQGPECGGWVYDLTECDALVMQAITGWNDRHARNRDLFDAGERDGLNTWPRK
jgi:hypothetical protein